MDPAAPGTVAFAVLKGSVIILSMMIMAYPVFRVISMWLEKSLDTDEALLYLGALLGLFVGIIVGWGTVLGWLLFLALIVGCLGFPVINRLSDRAALRRMEDEDIRKFALTLQHRERDVYARERLARIFLDRREYELALMHVKEALAVQPKDPGLTRLMQRIETEQRREHYRLKVCPKCYSENPGDAGACLSCGFRFMDPGDLLRALWTPAGLQALKWSGLGMLAGGLLLLVLHVSLLSAALLMLTGVATLFAYMYAHFSRR